jgi:hypothetical protein
VSLVAESLRFIGQSKAISDRKLREQIQRAQEEGDARMSRLDRESIAHVERKALRLYSSDSDSPSEMPCARPSSKSWTNPVFGHNALTSLMDHDSASNYFVQSKKAVGGLEPGSIFGGV